MTALCWAFPGPSLTHSVVEVTDIQVVILLVVAPPLVFCSYYLPQLCLPSPALVLFPNGGGKFSSNPPPLPHYMPQWCDLIQPDMAEEEKEDPPLEQVDK